MINELAKQIYFDNVEAGWWHDIQTGEEIKRNVGELLCLVHSEISEALEGYRKDLQDSHLPNRKSFEVELADAIIRILDIAGAHNLDLDGAIREKREYNKNRADHKLTNRRAQTGKKF
jgi:NTP pyrophosphatase (non-canonical NTP hydrolase)